ncbi:DUF6114 domain-containing protein [Kitasatospora acidiphila]|uniref:DUF6114 domain-containing protein n=1 Tax=Kitasatospora acidiphila TaxID=2567942 RepID=UPI001C678473|nr:DUF6114 domain-containing protein [Kitasatospora acidiphila]
MAEQTPTPEPRPTAEEAPEPILGAGEARGSEETAWIAAPPTAAPGGTGADPQAAAASEATVPRPASAGGAAVAASTADGPAPVGGPAAPEGERSWAEVPTSKQRRTFKEWRGARPFWGGLLVLLGGAEILFTEKMPLPVIMHIGMQGLAGLAVPSVMVLCGVLLIFSPGQRVFYSILSVLLTLASWITSNLGGFFIGLLLGLAGSIVAFGWVPNQPARRRLLRRGTRPSTS